MAKSDDRRLDKRLRALLARSRAAAHGLPRPARIPDYSTKQPGVAPLSNVLAGACTSPDKLNAHKYRRGAEERPETVKEAQDWSKRAAPLYNKGAVQVIGKDDAPHLGRK